MATARTITMLNLCERGLLHSFLFWQCCLQSKCDLISGSSPSIQRILQPYVDDLFQALFTVPGNIALPKAIKYLFDFLDLQAADMGISDPEVLHTWKTNRLHDKPSLFPLLPSSSPLLITILSQIHSKHLTMLYAFLVCSLLLRFWVSLIKNPEFAFDIHKSATVDSCLSVISQAYIDACSTSEAKYTKDTPSAKLLYVNEVNRYKEGVRQ